MGGGDMYEKPDDYSPLDHLTGLKVFEYFGAGKFDRYEALQKMPELHTLLLTHRKIGSYDIDQIKQIPSLENLSLGLCEISDDSGIGTLSGIKVLELGGASMTDPSELAEMDSVEILYLSGFEADDYSFLLGMESLKKLYIDKDKLPEEIKSALEKKGVEM
jgi:Leucine-rich repeat (LRR) protein